MKPLNYTVHSGECFLSSAPAGYKCTCADGFRGLRCELSDGAGDSSGDLGAAVSSRHWPLAHGTARAQTARGSAPCAHAVF